jgi:hypothetical protein
MMTASKAKGYVGIRWFVLLTTLIYFACSSDTSEEPEYNPGPYQYEASSWERFDVIDLEGQAALNPNVQAQMDREGNVHIFYYQRGQLFEENQTRYQIHHIVWDPETQALVGENEIIPVQSPNPGNSEDSGLNNCNILTAAVTSTALPIVAYQGGDIPQAEDGTICNATAQGDLMINQLGGGTWNEYLGLMGDASPKNPYFTDGYIGVAASIVVDRQNAIHMCGQHYYEFCDWTASKNPDLLYARLTQNQLGHHSLSMEEHVDDYNTYGSGGGVQSAMGYHCKIALDQNDNPFIFYVGMPIQDGIGEDDRGLRMAEKSGAQWVPESIEVLDEWNIEWLSGAVDSTGKPGVAYFMVDIDQNGDYPNHLRYAHRGDDGQWNVAVVDNSAQCGDFCSLTFDGQNRPAIAYYVSAARSATYRKHKDLKFAHFIGGSWQIETVATAGDIGQYNTLWYDAGGVPYICSYELNEQKIVILRKES